MKNNFLGKYMMLTLCIIVALVVHGQDKGKLFIIGGGERPPSLIRELVQTANLNPKDYIVILPMATSIPAESVAAISSELQDACKNHISSFNFTKAQANDNKNWIDSVQHARLIFITGGDQNKFMEVVRGSKLYDAMHLAFHNGTTISGTSAGAAVMSEIMITGEEKDKADKNDFKEIKINNTVTSQGMGFITAAIIDQHFIKRSRYNRLLSLLSDHPDKMVIGIDESTAIIVAGKQVKVAGESQVIVISNPKKLQVNNNDKVIFKNASLSLFSSGESFELK